MDKKQKATENLINKKDTKNFQYTVTAASNYKKAKKDPQRKLKIKPSVDKYNWEGINFQSELDYWKKMRKIMQEWLLMICMLKKKKYILLMFLNIIQIVNNKLFYP